MPANYTVTGTGDAGIGNAFSGDLRYCITQADNVNASSQITFQTGVTGTITLATQLPALIQDITITGPGSTNMTVQRSPKAGANFSVFSIDSGHTVVISGLTISNGSLSGIQNNGVLTVADCTISNNTGGPTGGGGLVNAGSATVTATTFTNNTASGGSGGGILNTGGSITVKASLFDKNSADSGGGFASINGTYNISNSTFTNNVYIKEGGGIFLNASTGKSVNNTIDANVKGQILPPPPGSQVDSRVRGQVTQPSQTLGGGIYLDSASSMQIVNTVVAGNTADEGNDVYGVIVSEGANFIGDGSYSSGWLSSDMVGTTSDPLNPMLGPLQDNGGPTFTMRPLSGSPLLGAGNVAYVANGDTDQRGYPRIVNGLVDIGAVEVQSGEQL